MNKEASLQISAYEIIQYLKPQNAFIFHPANGELRDGATARKLKLMGVQPGVADLAILLQGGRSAFIELKVHKRPLSMAQIRFREACTLLCHEYRVCRSVEEVIKALWEMGVDFENHIDFETSVLELAH